MRLVLLLLSGLLFSSCSRTGTNSTEEKIPSGKNDSVKAKEGVLGIYNIPEILTLAIKDSGAVETIGEKIANAYASIQSDIDSLHLHVEGSQGLLIYKNDPKNFVFECVVPVNGMPAVKPKNSSIVILEQTKAVLYDYYGAYDKMNEAYEKLKVYLNENKLVQTSATREFYVSDPQSEPDTSKWLSKIYIPVK